MALTNIRISILTVSDRCSRGESVDSSGAALKLLVEQSGGSVVDTKCVPDDFIQIKDTLNSWAGRVNGIITTGGTGLGPRDVTPEATEAVVQRQCLALAFAVIGIGSSTGPPTACLSRAIAGTCHGTLIINLPGSERAVRECWIRLQPVLRHASNVLLNDLPAIQEMHEKKSVVDEGQVATRARQSEWPMISVSDALEMIRSSLPPPDWTLVLLEVSVGRVVAEDVVASVNLPPFRASVMDGYAVSLPEMDVPQKWPVIAAAPAGSNPFSGILQPGQCVRVSTGGPVPTGSNIAVVPVEQTSLVEAGPDGSENLIEISSDKINPGQFIREIGSDMKVGEKLLSKGDIIDPVRVAVLASSNISNLPVFKLPVVGVMSTGDELASVGSNSSDKPVIYDSNRPALLALLKENKFPCVDLGICTDRPDNLMNHIIRAESCCDVIITSGGVSMGEKDYLKRVLSTDFSANIHFGRVNLKPGKPTTYATWGQGKKKKFLFGLPGNPVSTMVTSYLFVLPALRFMAGYPEPDYRTIPVEVTEDIKLDPRPEYKRAIVVQKITDGKIEPPRAHITGVQASSRIISLNDANALLKLPQKSENEILVKKGSTCPALLIGPMKFI